MNLRYRPALDEAAMSSEQVLLEHWVTFSGRQLALRVTTADIANPDMVVIHVRYDGQAEVIVTADGEGSSEGCETACAVSPTPDPENNPTAEFKEHCPSVQEKGIETPVVNALDSAFSANLDEMSSKQEEGEEKDAAPLAVSTDDKVLAPDREQSEMIASTSSKELDQEPPIVATGDQAGSASTGCAKTSSSSSEGYENSGNLLENLVSQDGDPASTRHATKSPSPETTSNDLLQERHDSRPAPCGELSQEVVSASAGHVERSSSPTEENQNLGPPSGGILIREVDSSSTKQEETSSLRSQEPQASDHVPESDVSGGVDLASTKQVKAPSPPSQEHEDSGPPSGSDLSEEVESTFAKLAETYSPPSQGHKDSGPLSESGLNQEAGSASTEQGETSSPPSQEHEASESVSRSGLGQKVDSSSTEHARGSSSPDEECQESEPPAGSTLSGKVGSLKDKSDKSAMLSHRQQCSTPLTGDAPDKAVKSSVKTLGIDSDVSEHVGMKRIAANVMSRPVGNVAGASSTRPTELRIGRFDLPAVLDDDALERMLRDMPSLRSLSVDWRLDGRKLDIDIVSQYCPNLVELDLSRFRFDAWSLEQMCMACPKLEVVKLPRKSDDSCVEVLLRNLPKLRSLDLTRTNVTGQFLEKSHESLEKLSLAGCKNLKLENLGESRQTSCWTKVQKLDISSTSLTTSGLAKVLGRFPRLELLSLAHCDMTGSDTFLQVVLCKHLHDLDASHVGTLEVSLLWDVLVRCPLLERLSIAGCTVREFHYRVRTDLNRTTLSLRELDVSEVKGLSTVRLTAILTHSPKLRRALASQLDGMDLTACLTQLSRCAELRELDVSFAGTLGEVDTKPRSGYHYYSQRYELEQRLRDFGSRQIQPAVLTSLLSGCQKLERLAVAGCYISEPDSLSQLARCPKLRELDLSRMTTRKTAAEAPGPDNCLPMDATQLAKALSGCPLLEHLSIAGIKAPLEEFVPPTGLPNLTYLDVSQSGLTSNSLRRLPNLFPMLQTLNLQGCTSLCKDGLMSYLPRLKRLRSLDLREISGMSNTVLEALKKCQLTKLRASRRFGDYYISGDGLLRLVLGCPSLKLLMLEESDKFTVGNIGDTFRRGLPLHRTLVLCFTKNSGVSEQTAPLFVLDSRTVNWDETGVSVVLQDGS